MHVEGSDLHTLEHLCDVAAGDLLGSAEVEDDAADVVDGVGALAHAAVQGPSVTVRLSCIKAQSHGSTVTVFVGHIHRKIVDLTFPRLNFFIGEEFESSVVETLLYFLVYELEIGGVLDHLILNVFSSLLGDVLIGQKSRNFAIVRIGGKISGSIFYFLDTVLDLYILQVLQVSFIVHDHLTFLAVITSDVAGATFRSYVDTDALRCYRLEKLEVLRGHNVAGDLLHFPNVLHSSDKNFGLHLSVFQLDVLLVVSHHRVSVAKDCAHDDEVLNVGDLLGVQRGHVRPDQELDLAAVSGQLVIREKLAFHVTA